MDSPTVLCIDQSTSAGAAQGNSRISWLLRHDSVERLHRDEDVEGNGGGWVLLEYKHEGMDAEAVAYQIKQRFPNLRSSCFRRTTRCQSESCGWWMNT